MTKREVLERLFSAEVESAVGARCSRIVQFRKSKLITAMESAGLIEENEETLGGRFPVRIKGHVLTPRGHFIYCTQYTNDVAEPTA